MKKVINKIENGEVKSWVLYLSAILKFLIFMSFVPSIYFIGKTLSELL